MHLLEVEPELRAVAEELCQAQSRIWRLSQSRVLLLRFDVGSENGIHACQVSFAARTEPFDHVAIEAQVNGGLSSRHRYPRGFPEFRAQRLSLRGARACPVFA